jgi:hypothetical protein
MSKIALTPNASGTGVFTISSPATNTNRTLTLPDEAGTVLTSASSIPTSALTGNIIQNAGPAFSASLGSSQLISDATTTKVQISVRQFDTDNCFDTSNYRFIPNVAGYYQINGMLFFNITGTSDASIVTHIYKNGATWRGSFNQGGTPNGYYGGNVSGIVYCNGTTDYIELYVFMVFGASKYLTGNPAYTCFDGAMVRAA